MSLPRRASRSLALAAGFWLGLGPAAMPAGSAPAPGASPASDRAAAAPAAGNPTAAAKPTSSTPSLGEAFAPSNPSQMALAEHLRARGVVFYGAFWCQHCFRQKVLFGQEAGNRLPYVECAKDEAGARACEAAGVVAYPTWVMGSERRVGVQSLQELASWTRYQGPVSFPASKTGL